MAAVAVVVLFFFNLCRFVHLSRFASLFHCLVNRSVIQLVSFFSVTEKSKHLSMVFLVAGIRHIFQNIQEFFLFCVCLFERFECILFVQVEFVSPFSKAIPCFDRHSKSPAIIHSFSALPVYWKLILLNPIVPFQIALVFLMICVLRWTIRICIRSTQVNEFFMALIHVKCSLILWYFDLILFLAILKF